MAFSRLIEYIFFFGLLAGAGYLVWQVLSPFIVAIALSVIIVTICYPLYDRIRVHSYKQSKSIAAALTTAIVVVAIVLPLVLMSTVFVRELASFYQTLSAGQELSIDRYTYQIETAVQQYIPEFQINLTNQLRQTAEWLVGNIGAIFAGTISTIFIVLISLIGSFYFFRDGKEFLSLAIKISPLRDSEDEIIFTRLTKAVRSVVTGVVLLSIIQGLLAAVGFAIFGIEQAVLWGAVGAVLAMIPGLGTLAIMIPGTAYLFLTGATGAALGLAIWTVVTVVLIDNILGPYLMSRGNKLHPFIMLTSVLGGLSAFGPIGFVIGPVVVTLFIVLLEQYEQYMSTKRSVK